jgi:pimeloyl-ACP methyl ester carboxylesterase
LGLRLGAHARSTLSALFTTALAATTSLDAAVGFLPGLRAFDQTSTLGSVRTETIVLSGGADLLTPATHADEMTAAIPGATHVHLPMAGHMLLHEAAHAVTDAISRTVATRIGDRSQPRSVSHLLGQPNSQHTRTA